MGLLKLRSRLKGTESNVQIPDTTRQWYFSVSPNLQWNFTYCTLSNVYTQIDGYVQQESRRTYLTAVSGVVIHLICNIVTAVLKSQYWDYKFIMFTNIQTSIDGFNQFYYHWNYWPPEKLNSIAKCTCDMFYVAQVFTFRIFSIIVNFLHQHAFTFFAIAGY